MNKKPNHPVKFKDVVRALFVALAVTLVVAGFQLAFPTPELASYDARLRLERKLAPMPVRDDVVVLGIDDQALLAHARWPWPRRDWADVLEALIDVKARGVFFDVTFPDATATTVPTSQGRMTLAQAVNIASTSARQSFSDRLAAASDAKTVPATSVPQLEGVFAESFGLTESFLKSIAVPDDQVMGEALALARAGGMLTGGVMSIEGATTPARAEEAAALAEAVRWLHDNPGKPVEQVPGVDRAPLSAHLSSLKAAAAFTSSADGTGVDVDRELRQLVLDALVDRGVKAAELARGTRDELLRKALPATWTLSGYAGASQFDQALTRKLLVSSHVYQASPPPTDAPRPAALVLPIFDIAHGYRVMGGDWELKDSDGLLRSVPLFQKLEQGLIPNAGLALYLALLADDAQGQPPKLSFERDALLIVSARAGGPAVRIPLLPGGRAQIHWVGALDQSFPLLSLAPVLSYATARHDRRVQLARVPDQSAVRDLLDLLRPMRLDPDAVPLSLNELVGRLPPNLKPSDPARWLDWKLPDAPASADEKLPPARWHAFLSAVVARIEDEYLTKNIGALKKKLAEKDLPEAKAATYRAKLAPLERIGPGLDRMREELGAALRGKICVIGHVATSSTDLAPMAFSTAYPKVGVYPSLLNTISSGRFLARPWAVRLGDPAKDAGPGVQLWLLFAVCTVAALGVTHLSARRAVVYSAMLGAVWCAVAAVAFLKLGLWIDLVGPLSGIVFTHTALFSISHSRTENVRKMFESYVDPRIVEVIIEDETLWNELGGREQVITAFFSDIAGFTTLSELLGAHELSDMLTDYLSPMTDIILSHDGVRDKYIGDAIVAFFGAPVVAPGHELNACLSSIAQQEHMLELKEQWKRDKKSWYERVLAAGMDLEFRIGLNTGKAKVGNFGARNSKNYTMIGDTVNLAARLEGANKEYGSFIMAAEPTIIACGDKIVTRELDRLVVKGKLEAARVFEVIGRTGAVAAFWPELLGTYREGLTQYHQREFAKAKALFEQCLKIRPGDGPAEVYVERSQEFIDHPPAADWNGTYVMKHK